MSRGAKRVEPRDTAWSIVPRGRLSLALPIDRVGPGFIVREEELLFLG
jgi:hypothetical protein